MSALTRDDVLEAVERIGRHVRRTRLWTEYRIAAEHGAAAALAGPAHTSLTPTNGWP